MERLAVRLVGVSKSYGNAAALAGVSFDVREGEAVGYLGPNGAGKTTTLRLLTGLVRPDRGTIRLLGRDPYRDATARHAIGALIETPGLLPYLAPRDLLRYVAEVRRVPRADRATAIASAVERAGAQAALDRPMGDLSTGLARRALLATALVGDPPVLLLDEPTLGLDPAARLDLRRTLSELREEGRTLLLSTHVLEDVEAVCDRVLFLKEGQLVGDESLAVRRGHDAALALRFRFLAPVRTDRLGPLLRMGESLRAETEDRLLVQGVASGRRQAELVEGVAALELGLIEAAPAGSELEARYLRTVGREEGT